MPGGLILNGRAGSVRVCQWVPDAGRGAAQVPAQVWLVLEGQGHAGLFLVRFRSPHVWEPEEAGPAPFCLAPTSKVLRPLGAARAQLT